MASLTSLNNPNTLTPYMNTRDCSQGFCSFYCPQWCYLNFPPPPQTTSSSSSSFSPLVIAIIGILASAFLLVSYYAVVSKFCKASSDGNRENWPHSDDMGNNHNYDNNHEHDHVENEPWNSRAIGLDEALIKMISVCKYKKNDKAFSSTDCSVCLGEFEEDEALRLLPKCRHFFHVACIDKWLKTHSSCPLCRSNIVSMFTLETTQNGQMMEPQGGVEQEDLQGEIVEFSNESEIRQSRRRSMSMDHSRISIEDEDCEMEECQLHGLGVDHTKDQVSIGEEAYRVLQCVMKSSLMKRSFSSGRFSFARNSRGRNSGILV